MAMIKKSITLTDVQDEWVKAQIASGHYGNESEVIRELIRERQLYERETKNEINLIRKALIDAELNGSSGFTIEQAWTEARKRRVNRG